VQCLSEISKVLSVGLMVSGDPIVHYGHTAVASPTTQTKSVEVLNNTEVAVTSVAPGEERGEDSGPCIAAVP
jgi:hypothetical protein